MAKVKGVEKVVEFVKERGEVSIWEMRAIYHGNSIGAAIDSGKLTMTRRIKNTYGNMTACYRVA